MHATKLTRKCTEISLKSVKMRGLAGFRQPRTCCFNCTDSRYTANTGPYLSDCPEIRQEFTMREVVNKVRQVAVKALTRSVVNALEKSTLQIKARAMQFTNVQLPLFARNRAR